MNRIDPHAADRDGAVAVDVEADRGRQLIAERGEQLLDRVDDLDDVGAGLPLADLLARQARAAEADAQAPLGAGGDGGTI